jgi:hypothetical protein
MYKKAHSTKNKNFAGLNGMVHIVDNMSIRKDDRSNLAHFKALAQK